MINLKDSYINFFKSKQQSFILEFAPLQPVKLKRIAKVTWDNAKQFLLRIGSLIICLNVIMFILSSFNFSFEYVRLTNNQSMLETLGTILAPVFTPLGFGNWGSVSALLSGLVAKETVLSSIAIFNNLGATNTSLQASLSNPTSQVFFTPFSAASFLVFCLLYTPCITTLAVIRKELGIKFALFSLVYQLIIAYLISFLVYSVLTLNFVNLLIAILITVLSCGIIVIFKLKKVRFKKKFT